MLDATGDQKLDERVELLLDVSHPGYTATLVALALSASRSSRVALAAVVVVFLVRFPTSGGTSAWTRWATFAVLARTTVAVVVIALTTTTDDAWSNRRAIRIASLD